MNDRYFRQIPIIGEKGQDMLHESTVFLAGTGGLGSPVGFYLSAAGIGNLRIADSDTIEITNMNRQILHTDERIGTSKAESARKTILALNPDVKVTAFNEFIDEFSAKCMIGNADIIVDALDNFTGRYVLNVVSRELEIPLVHAAVAGLCGQATLIIPGKTPCLSCIFPSAVTTKKTPVLGTTAGIIGSIEAQETIKYLTNTGETLAGKLLVWDGEINKMDIFSVKRSKTCQVCG
ncbi:MAG: HesA/MoeB/ThiF family protein [Methanocorpusculum sp.]|uniref:HesA/MoeB/ThiF family protein n=1 Tax=unclassified Methanocorpusculum TaxID=225464 RepID=UPI001432DF53|nr:MULTISPECIES: HesA/MoeB/ThiF family protein [unclassified Methanocorpusculum]MEA5085603.1 HesA/MoeB/ThiF family protein [Methanocorpusculum sp.]